MTSNRNIHRRGIAMLLVLFSVAMATILATAYLVSRDNSIAISRNSAAAAQARWSAMSALNTTVAILQTETNWRQNHTAGTLLSNYELAGGTIEITAIDLETGIAPGPSTEYLKLTAIARVDADGDGRIDGQQESQFLAYVPIIAKPRVAVDLAEFAVFVRNDLTMTNNASLARWPTAPLSKLGRRIAVGTHSEGSGSIEVRDNAACIDGTVYHVNTASGALVINDNGPPIARFPMPFKIPFPAAPEHGEPDPPVSSSDLDLNGQTATITAYDRYDDLDMLAGSVLTLQGDVTFVCDDDFMLRGGSKVVIDGNVTIVVFDDIWMEANSSIELTPASTLKIFNGDDITIKDGYIGQQRTDNTRDHTGYEPYMDTWRIQVYSIEDMPTTARIWNMTLNSVVKGSYYGETVIFKLGGDSALYGRVAAENVVVANNSSIFYDHALDSRQGYTNPKSPLFDNGNFDALFLASTLDASELVTLANLNNTVIHAGGFAYAPTAVPPPPPPIGPTDPTPRPVPVEHLMITYGTNMNIFEFPSDITDLGEGSSKSGGEELSGF